jgi:hypothetical protein
MSRYAVIALLLVLGSSAGAQVADPPQREGFLRQEFTPGASLKLGLGLLYDQATVAVPEWGSGRAGLARRAEWLGAGWLARASTEYIVAARRGVDTGYRPCDCKGFPRRAAHALRSGFVEYRSDGTPIFAVARFSGLAAGGLATMPMMPAGYGLSDAARRTVVAFGVDEGFHMLHEFRKEIVRTLLLRRAPRSFVPPSSRDSI